jgi:hypothetical protein
MNPIIQKIIKFIILYFNNNIKLDIEENDELIDKINNLIFD